jgi:hypothetical protein
VPSTKEWLAITAFVTFVLMPICWKFWRGWDRPSRAAKTEMARRKHERDIRDAFIIEDAKAREQEHIAAEMALSRRKAQAPTPVAQKVLSNAFGSLGETDETPLIVHPDIEIQEVADVSDMVEGLETDEIEESVIPEAAPVAVQIRAESTAADEVEWKPQATDDDWSDIGWS